jgi:hypothetical protein
MITDLHKNLETKILKNKNFNFHLKNHQERNAGTEGKEASQNKQQRDRNWKIVRERGGARRDIIRLCVRNANLL